MNANALSFGLALRPADLIGSVAGSLLQRERRLALAGFVILALMVPTAAALLIDGRTLNGIPVWVKPLKFQASVGIYLLTLAWLFGSLPERTRGGRVEGALVAAAIIASVFEIGYITLQAGQGLASHYNVGDAIYSAMYTLMGVGAVTLTAVSPALAVLLARHRPPSWPMAFWLSVLIGLVLTFVLGAGTGAVLSADDGHWIGGSRSDAGGVPLFGWSRTGGDLRVAHFLGMHALHALPVIGLAASHMLSRRAAVLTVCGAGLAYCAITGLVIVQALRGLPLFPV